MKLTTGHQVQIRLLSDSDLYRQAITFAQKHPSIENRQMTGLVEFSRSWKELTDFVKHQKGRDWGKKEHYSKFYTALDAYLTDLRRDVKNKHGFVPDGLTTSEARGYTDYFSGLLAREFIQHLAAEMMWKREVK